MNDTTNTNRRAVVLGLATSVASGRHALAQGLPTVAVTKDPTCGCCGKWVAHLRDSGCEKALKRHPAANRT